MKNVNSFRYIRSALEYEIERQIELIESGGRVVQETRLWNAAEGRTYSMRSKEQAHDYRYFPEPDLPPLIVSAEWKAEILKAMPELPEAKRARFMAEYELNAQDAQTLTATQEFAGSVRGRRKSGKEPAPRRQPRQQRAGHPAQVAQHRTRKFACHNEGHSLRRRPRRRGQALQQAVETALRHCLREERGLFRQSTNARSHSS